MIGDCIVPVEGDEVEVKVEFQKPGGELGNAGDDLVGEELVEIAAIENTAMQ